MEKRRKCKKTTVNTNQNKSSEFMNISGKSTHCDDESFAKRGRHHQGSCYGIRKNSWHKSSTEGQHKSGRWNSHNRRDTHPHQGNRYSSYGSHWDNAYNMHASDVVSQPQNLKMGWFDDVPLQMRSWEDDFGSAQNREDDRFKSTLGRRDNSYRSSGHGRNTRSSSQTRKSFAGNCSRYSTSPDVSPAAHTSSVGCESLLCPSSGGHKNALDGTDITSSLLTSVISSHTSNVMASAETALDPVYMTTAAVSSTLTEQKQKPALEDLKYSQDSRLSELSLKASEIIESILKGEKVSQRLSEPRSSTNSKSVNEVNIPEKQSEKSRTQKEEAKVMQEDLRIHTAGNTGLPNRITAIHQTNDSSCISTKGLSQIFFSDSGSERSAADVTSSPKPSFGSPCQGSQKLNTSKSFSLKDSIIKMLRYPKSRRGTSQIEKLLQQSRVPAASRQRLINLVKPLSEPEKPELDFLQLSPDVQEHILNLVDEVMLEMETEKCVSPSENVNSDPSNHLAKHRQVSLNEGRLSVNINLNEIPDVKHHFDDLLTGNAVLHAVSDANQSNTMKELASTSNSVKADPGVQSAMPHSQAPVAEESHSNIVPPITIKQECVDNSPTETTSRTLGEVSSQAAVPNQPTEKSNLAQPSKNTPPDQPVVICDLAYVKQESTDSCSQINFDAVSSSSCNQAPVQAAVTAVETTVQQVNETALNDNDDASINSEDQKTAASKSKIKRPYEKLVKKTSKSRVSRETRTTKAKRAKINETASTTDGVVDELYNIAIEEDELREKMVETNKAISELQELLDSTKARLECRQKYMKELEDREASLRKRRLELLKEAKNLSRATSLESENSLPPDSSLENKITKKKKLKKKVNTKSTSTSTVSDNVAQPDTTVDSSTATNGATKSKKTLHKAEIKTTKQKNQSKLSSSEDKAGDVPKVDMSFSEVSSEAKFSGNVSIKYLGSFNGKVDVQSVLQRLSQNFKNLKPVTSTEFGDGGIKTDLLQLNSVTTVGATSDAINAQFNLPEQSASKINQTNSKVKKSARKKIKTRSACGQSTTSSSDSESEQQRSAKEKKAPKKRKKDKGTSKIIQEYLHCSSSSDVELDGFERQSEKVTTTSDSVTDGNSFEATPKYIPLSGKSDDSNNKVSSREGVFAEVMKGPVSCLFAWKRYLLVTGQDSQIKYLIKNKPANPSARTLCNHTESIKVIHVSTDQDQTGTAYLYTGSLDKSLVISNFNTGIYVSQHQCPAPIRCGSPGWGRLYLGLENGSLLTFDIQRYHIEHTYQAASSAIIQIATGQEGTRHLLCICEESQPAITLRDARNKLFIRSLEGHLKTPNVLKVKNHFVYSGGADNMVQIHDILTGNMESLLRFQSAVTEIVVSSVLIVGEKRGVVNIIQHKDHIRERVIYTHDTSPVTALLFDRPNNILYVGEETGRLEAVSLATRSHKCQFSYCSGYAFGERSHMLHHIIIDHVAPCIKGKVMGIVVEQLPHIFKCLWKDCKDYIYIKNSMKEAEEHIFVHVDEAFSASDQS